MEGRESMISRGLPKMSEGQRTYDQSWVTVDGWRTEKSMNSRGLPMMSEEKRKYDQSLFTEDEWRAEKV
jgi:hypothetical protein